VALLGVIALMGMIMRNSVILIDQIEQDRRRGVPPGTPSSRRRCGASAPSC
jgi:multidrug efflux pump subunit AcrB